MNGEEAVSNYIRAFPVDVQEILQAIRQAIASSVPNATECINYGIPTFQLNTKNIIHYAAFTKHIGLYATPDGHAEFDEELSKYKHGKGSVQFPIDQPMPMNLIKRIAAYRAEQLNEGEK